MTSYATLGPAEHAQLLAQRLHELESMHFRNGVLVAEAQAVGEAGSQQLSSLLMERGEMEARITAVRHMMALPDPESDEVADGDAAD